MYQTCNQEPFLCKKRDFKRRKTKEKVVLDYICNQLNLPLIKGLFGKLHVNNRGKTIYRILFLEKFVLPIACTIHIRNMYRTFEVPLWQIITLACSSQIEKKIGKIIPCNFTSIAAPILLQGINIKFITR